ncbi:hypothetical protein AMTR_s00001p00270120 [Amborella trichopoda]|uniref:Uncharacterized protein n=1 Tax=Amborella trichopoda TaxID=13333 RepID=W1NMS3_AMBTC|nr:hypothetical protein AMTR_s00001p00270120 [Amborella trichopoda]
MWTNRLGYFYQVDKDIYNGKSTREYIEWYKLRTGPLIHNPFRKCPSKYAHRGYSDEDRMPKDISHATELLHEVCNSRNWDLAEEALQILKIYDPEVVGEEVSEELELGDEMDDSVPV